MLFCRGGHDDRKGHYHGTAEGIKAATRHSEGSGEGNQAGGGSRDPFPEFETDPKDHQENKDGRGERGHPQIEGQAFQPVNSGEDPGGGDQTLSVPVF